MSASCDEIVPKVKEIVEKYARYTASGIARTVGISLSRVHYMLKNILNIVTGDETWVHYFKPFRKVTNKVWATKNSKDKELLNAR